MNKYNILYLRIINNAKLHTRTKKNAFYENHHITPKSLGGNNSKTNLVLLTPREHFICHYLLCKMYSKQSVEWYKMVNAFNMMSVHGITHNRYINSRLYSIYKKEHSRIMSEFQSGSKNSQFGTVWIHMDDTKKKIKKEELTRYLSLGWALGRVPKKIKVKKQVFYRDKRMLTDAEVIDVKNSMLSTRKLAEKYSVNHNTIWKIRKCKSYKDTIAPFI